MELVMKEFAEEHLPEMTEIWNDVVEEGISFPGDKALSEKEALKMFREQASTVCATLNGEVVGVYILHPNNAGHCAHIANASYGVSSEARGTGMGERLVRHSLEMCRKHGFVGLQFNAVVSSNTAAIRLYEKLGFVRIGTAKNGDRFKDGHYEDLFLFNKPLI